MSKIFKRITAVFLAFLIMFWAVPNITEWAPMNDVSMAGEDDESDVNVSDELDEDLDGSVVTINGYDFTRRTGELVIYKEYYFEELYGIAYEYGFSLSYDVKKIIFRNGSRIVYGDDNSSDAFSYFFNLESVDMSGADASEFEYTDNMFLYCKKLKNVKLPVFSNDMTSAKGMFKGCESLETIDLSNYNASNLKNTEEMFDECKNLTTIKVNDTWNNSNITSSTNMFNNCTNLVGSNGTVFDASHTDKEYARIDTPDTPGYLTFKQTVTPPITTTKTTTSTKTTTKAVTTTTKPLSGNTAVLSGDTLTLKGKVVKADVQAYANNSNVKKVVAATNAVLPADCSDMFHHFLAVSIDLSQADSSNVTNTNNMFSLCIKLQELNISGFSTSNVTDMMGMFFDCHRLQTLDLSNFDTSNVTSMRSMFSWCSKLQTLDISNFDTSKVTDMSRMFCQCYTLQTLDLSNFDTSKVTDMECMFYNDKLLETIIVGNKWNTSKVEVSSGMFADCISLVGGNGTVYDSSHTDAEYARIDTPETPGYLTFKQTVNPPITTTKTTTSTKTTTKAVTSTTKPLSDNTAVLSGDTLTLKGNVVKADVQAYARISAVKKVVAEKGAVLPAYCSDMFNNFKAVSIDLSQADSSNVITINGMFYNCNNLVELNLSGFNTSKVISMSNMFAGCGKLKTLDLSSFDTSKVPKMAGLFYGCSNLTYLDISSFDTSKVTDMNKMFAYCRSLKTVDLSNFNTSKVTNMNSMFGDCSSLQSLDMSNFDTSNVTNMSSMFGDCSSLQSLDMSNFDTSNVTNMSCMFYDCNKLQSLDLSGFNTSKVTNMNQMFLNCENLKTIIADDKWDTSNVNDSSNMFLRCISLVGGNGTKYYGSHIDKRYALIDTPETPGYFTLPDKILYGDTNCSGDVRMNDAVLIMLVLANGDAFDVGGTDKLAITEKGRINADCYHPGSGLTNMDATAIQKYLIGKNALPE